MTPSNSGISLPPGTNILIIDDMQENIALLSRRLTTRGMNVFEANDGIEALELLTTSAIDIVLCDVMMPGMSGLEVVKRIRSKRSQAALPIIMVSARTDQTMIVECLQAGANDYVTKPIDFQVVCARIQVQLTIRETYKAALTDRTRHIRRAEEAVLKLAEAETELEQLKGVRKSS